MPISEAQLETWSHQGQTGQFTSTYETLRTVLRDNDAPYANRSFEIFLQGSYGNDTNIYADSDVDIVIWSGDSYYSDTSNLDARCPGSIYKELNSATYTLADFKKDVVAWLTQKFSTSSVKPGSKAVFIAGKCVATRRRYYRGNRIPSVSQILWGPYTPDDFVQGICFFNSSGTRVENFPKQHSENCTIKHQATNRWFKRSVRTYKNLRNKMIDEGMIEEGDSRPPTILKGCFITYPTIDLGELMSKILPTQSTGSLPLTAATSSAPINNSIFCERTHRLLGAPTSAQGF